jgi:hypothetical protein
MRTGKDALVRIVGLVIGLIACGCEGGPQAGADRSPSFTSPTKPPVRFQSDVEPVADLRIADTPAPQADKGGWRGKESEAKQPSLPPPPATVPIPQPAEPDPLEQLRRLHRDASEQYAGIDSYVVRMRRREQINGKDCPEELMLFKFRKQPFSVYFKWLGKTAHGREVIYVKGRYESKLHTRVAAGDVPLMAAGRVISLSPDSSLVRSSCRHSIEEAGIGVMIDGFGRQVDALAKGRKQSGTLKYLGLVKRPEFEGPCEATEEIIPPKTETLLPRGGRRWLFFNPVMKLPTLLITHDETGHQVEYYCYDRFEYPVHLDDEDFNPGRWGR